MGEHVHVSCPAGEITGNEVDGVRYFHSIPHLEFATFSPAGLAAPTRIDARTPRPETVALTVTAPAGAAPGDDLPVLAYIHGGAYETGSHEEPRTEAGAFARDGVITVTLGYRRGPAGFIRFHDDEPDRYRGVDDCLLGLQWIQRNIESFGGDPTNVTLAGQSAGAGISLWLTRRDHYRGEFRRVLAISPAFPRQTFEDRKGSLRNALTKPVTRATLSGMRPSALHRGYRRFNARHATDMALGPAPFDATQLSEMPVLVTETREEFYDHPLGTRLDRAGFSDLGARLLGRTMGVTAVRAYLARARENDPSGVARQLIGDSLIRRWASKTAEQAPGPVWLSELAGTPDRPALHCCDLPLVFDNLAHGSYYHDPADPQAQRLADLIHGEVLEYAHGRMPAWPRYRAGEGGRQARLLRLNDVAAGPSVIADPLAVVRASFH